MGVEESMEYEGYKIEHMGTFSLYKIKNKGQGPAPKALAGYFQTVNLAQKAIDGYLSTKGKVTTNGKIEGGSKG